MGQAESSSPARALTIEESSRLLAAKFASKCFSGVELYSFKANFKALADNSDGLLYWKEATLIQFLGLPASLNVGPIIFQAASNLGAFPYPSLAPAILDFETLVTVVALVTGRCAKAMKRPPDRVKMLFHAFAIHDREHGHASKPTEEMLLEESLRDGAESDSTEDLSLDELITVNDVVPAPERHHARKQQIPLDNMRKLVMFLLAVSSLEENQPLAEFADRFKDDALIGLRATANAILKGFGEQAPGETGISSRAFRKTLISSMPKLFDPPIQALFAHFLFSKSLDLSARGRMEFREPLLSTTGNIMDLNILSQLSLFISGEWLWRRVRLLYAGSDAGFSLGSLEQKVVKWNAPTIFLISGRRMADPPDSASARSFHNALPPHKYPPGADPAEGDGRFVFGAFLETPWKASHKHCFGNDKTLLFQLEPVHHVFHASKTSQEYAYFNREDGVGFGTSPRKWKRTLRENSFLDLGPVSLVLDQTGLEYGVFTHTGSGGSFRPSDIRPDKWQVRLEIDEIEVWGCGGESEAEEQRKAWQWEEREALLRRQVSLGKDTESDRALLEMAGLIGQNRSGGSIG